jgi:shikimate kinase
VDIDRRIEKRAGKSIARIFTEEGEPVFREMEREVTAKAALKGGQVIACGGGVVLNEANTLALKQKAVVIYLDVSEEAVNKRVASSKVKRPLLAKGNSAKTVRELMKARRPLYEQAADITLDASDLSIEAAADKIIERLGEYEGFSL